MYAIVEIAGQQFKIEQEQKIFVHRIEAKEGSKVNFDKVLLMDDSGKVRVGSPDIKGAQVTAKVLEHLKGDKVIVFKKKRRKGYKVKNGHRQYLTKLEILKIDSNTNLAKKGSSKDNKVSEKVTEVKTSVVKKTTVKKAAEKKVAPKKKIVKKTTVKKATEKKVAPNKKIAKKTVVNKKLAEANTTKKIVEKK